MIFKPHYYFETGCAAYEELIDALVDLLPKPSEMERLLWANQGQGES